MQGDTSLVVDATRKASRFLQRDYFELENLQASDKKTTSFCQKSCTKAVQILQENLSKYYKTVIFDAKELEGSNFFGKAALVETMDGFGNFTRSLPFFAIMVTIVSKKNGEIIADRSVMNFPALGEIYYAEKGKGAWMDRYSSNVPGSSRVRVSGANNVKDALIAVTGKNIEFAKKISSDIRILDSYTYSLIMLISGKVDILICDERKISSKGVELFVLEAAGSVHRQNNLLIASNFMLHEKIKESLLVS